MTPTTSENTQPQQETAGQGMCPGSEMPGGVFTVDGLRGITCQVCARDFRIRPWRRSDRNPPKPPTHRAELGVLS